MKISRTIFKEIVKECLLELITEFASAGSNVKRVKSEGIKQQRVRSAVPGSQTHVRSAAAITTHSPVPTRSLHEAIERESGGDPVMTSILADTAKTTLPRLLKAGVAASVSPGSIEGVGVVQGDAAAQVVAAHEPEQLFGVETADRWAQLAFADARPGSSDH